jgi:KUP system potassium uptake protein
VITGAYSLSRQAIQLGLLPRMRVDHTSQEHSGQIYMPGVNWFLLIAVLILVLSFRSSSALASAYGIAVTTTMTVTGVLAFIVIHRLWGWSVLLTAAVLVPIIALDLTFFGSNLLKLHDGGWVPLAFGVVMMTLMLTWRKGSRILAEKTRRIEVPLKDLIASLEKRPPHKVSGTAIFLTASHDHAPTALLHNLKHNKVLHENNVLLKISSVDTPYVDSADRVSMEKISDSFNLVVIRYGYMETPNVPKALGLCRKMGWKFDIMSTSFFLSRRHLKASGKMGMPLWQDHIFITLALNANAASDYFHLPTGRVVEVGTQVTV